MARQKGMITIRGRVGDQVYTEGTYGRRVRSVPTLTAAQRRAKAKLPQTQRTAGLSRLAGALNRAVYQHARTLKSKDFYRRLHSVFRSVQSDERSVLLNHLHNLAVNPRYAFAMACPLPQVRVTPEKNVYNVSVEIASPTEDHKGYDSVSFEFILYVFEKGRDDCRHEVRCTPFISVGHKLPRMAADFEYSRTAKDTDYLLACRAVFARNGEHDGTWTSTVMQFLTGGAVTEKGLKQIEDYRKQRSLPKVKTPKPEEKKVMVALRVIKN